MELHRLWISDVPPTNLRPNSVQYITTRHSEGDDFLMVTSNTHLSNEKCGMDYIHKLGKVDGRHMRVAVIKPFDF